MKCKIDGCNKEVQYKKDGVCQMHYFRFMRNGKYELDDKKRKYRISNPAGYQKLFEPEHFLADSMGYVYEHRKVIYDIYGNDLPDCELCGEKVIWETCHVDHIDEDVTNNSQSNLRAVCRGCNTGRTERTGIKKYTLYGKTMSLTEWAKYPGVQVSRAQVYIRLKKGVGIEDALFNKNLTHPKKYV